MRVAGVHRHDDVVVGAARLQGGHPGQPGDQRARHVVHLGVEHVVEVGLLVGVPRVALQHRAQLLDRGEGRGQRAAHRDIGMAGLGLSTFQASLCWFSLASSLGAAAELGGQLVHLRLEHRSTSRLKSAEAAVGPFEGAAPRNRRSKAVTGLAS